MRSSKTVAALRESAQLLGPDGLLTQLTQRVLNRALDAEPTEHLGYEKGDPAGRGSGNSVGAKVIKKYDIARTAYQRVARRPDRAEENRGRTDSPLPHPHPAQLRRDIPALSDRHVHVRPAAARVRYRSRATAFG
jgi:hypothetical protein